MASARLMAPILRSIRFTCVLTVSMVMTSSSAISAFEAPRTNLSNTSRSRSESVAANRESSAMVGGSTSSRPSTSRLIAAAAMRSASSVSRAAARAIEVR